MPGLAAYMALFLAADRTPRQSALLAPALMLFLFTGTYAQFPPILFPILLITSVARLRPMPAHHAPRSAPLPAVAAPWAWPRDGDGGHAPADHVPPRIR